MWQRPRSRAKNVFTTASSSIPDAETHMIACSACHSASSAATSGYLAAATWISARRRRVERNSGDRNARTTSGAAVDDRRVSRCKSCELPPGSRHEQLHLAAEVVVDRRGRHVGAGGDVDHGRSVEAELDARRHCSTEQAVPCCDAVVVDLRRTTDTALSHRRHACRPPIRFDERSPRPAGDSPARTVRPANRSGSWQRCGSTPGSPARRARSAQPSGAAS